MGIDHLIAVLGASWYMRSQEKKQARQETSIRASFLTREMEKQRLVSEYMERGGFNRQRQNRLRQLGQSSLRQDRQAFAELLGRPCLDKDLSVARGLRAIAEKEGWTYFDEEDLRFDP